jgi:hypothetical protein
VPTFSPSASPTKYGWEEIAAEEAIAGGGAGAQASVIEQATALEDAKKHLDTSAQVSDAVANIADYFSNKVVWYPMHTFKISRCNCVECRTAAIDSAM